MDLSVGVDTLVSLEDADAYMAQRVGADAWTSADPATRAAALATASRQINAAWRYRGGNTAPDRLQFPRPGETAVPAAVAAAACEQALWLLQQQGSPRAVLQAQGVTSINVGGVSESYDLTRVGRLCPEAERLLRPYRIAGGRLTR